jgi:hypothetical protein
MKEWVLRALALLTLYLDGDKLKLLNIKTIP